MICRSLLKRSYASRNIPPVQSNSWIERSVKTNIWFSNSHGLRLEIFVYFHTSFPSQLLNWRQVGLRHRLLPCWRFNFRGRGRLLSYWSLILRCRLLNRWRRLGYFGRVGHRSRWAWLFFWPSIILVTLFGFRCLFARDSPQRWAVWPRIVEKTHSYMWSLPKIRTTQKRKECISSSSASYFPHHGSVHVTYLQGFSRSSKRNSNRAIGPCMIQSSGKIFSIILEPEDADSHTIAIIQEIKERGYLLSFGLPQFQVVDSYDSNWDFKIC